jgi:CelD/BcsL family acetyltransferase involved in cellulose biosynthesis
MTTEPFTCTFETLDSTEALESLAGEWNDLVLAMPRPSPFLLHGWVAEWWRHFGSGSRLTVVVARRDGRLVGAAPLYVERSGGVRVARFLGAHESPLADLLLAEGEPESTAAGLLAELGRQPFDLADLFGLPGGSALERANTARLRLIERVEAPVLDMSAGWDTVYASKTGSKKRNLHRRRLRQLGELGEVEFVVGRTRAELEPLLEEAFLLHELRWRGRPDGATFGTEEGRAFHRAAMQRIADDGVLGLVLMRVGGQAAAFHYYFALNDTMYVHRLAFDPALARYSPGVVATLETLRVASEDGLTRVEYLGGDERYKLELADRLDPLFQGIGLSRTPLGSLSARQRLGVIQLRKTLKRSERLQRLYLNGLGSLRGGKKTPDTPEASD